MNKLDKSPKEKLITVKILPADHTELMHLKADTGKHLYILISEMLQDRRKRTTPSRPPAEVVGG